MERLELYKFLRKPFLADSVAKRSQNIRDERREKHREFFMSIRGNLDTSLQKKPEPIEKKKKSRAEMLQEWKAKKMKQLEEQQKKQKPIFKVGVVQRKATGSPINFNVYAKSKLVQLKKDSAKLNSITNDRRQGIMTRAMARTIENETEVKTVQEKKEPVKSKSKNKLLKIETGKRKPIGKHEFKVPTAVTMLPSNVRMNVRPISTKTSGKNEKGIAMKTDLLQKKEETVSSNMSMVKMSELKIVDGNKKRTSKSQDKVAPKTGTIRVSPRNRSARIQEEEKLFKDRVASFRKYIETETHRLLTRCDKWKCIYEEFQEIPPDIEGDIDSVIGKTKLLTSDKFMQFKDLIDKCEGRDPKIKIDDLQGFQDWVSIEVERIDEEFEKLEKRKCDNWKEETVPEKEKVEKGKLANKKVSKKPVGKSNIRAHILAARKMIKEGNNNPSPAKGISILKDEIEIKVSQKKSDSFDKEVPTSETETKTNKSANTSITSSIQKERGKRRLEIMSASKKNQLSTPIRYSSNSISKDFTPIIKGDYTPVGVAKKTTKSSSKSHIVKHGKENLVTSRGLDEKYFQPAVDESF